MGHTWKVKPQDVLMKVGLGVKSIPGVKASTLGRSPRVGVDLEKPHQLYPGARQHVRISQGQR